MEISKLRLILGWCCVLNFGLIFILSLFFLFGIDWVYNIQSSYIFIPREEYNSIWFLTIGIWKILVIVFNLIPYIALRIIGKTADSAPTVLP